MGDTDGQLAKTQASGGTAFVLRLKRSLFFPLAALMLLTVAMVPPGGDFPLNDDWIYAKTVEGILETGAYEANPYGDPTLIAQAYWGALFCSVFG